MKKITTALVSIAMIAAFSTSVSSQEVLLANGSTGTYTSGMQLNVNDVVHGPADVTLPNGNVVNIPAGRAGMLNANGTMTMGMIQTQAAASALGLTGVAVGGASSTMIFVGLGALIAAGVVVVATDDDDDAPNTP